MCPNRIKSGLHFVYIKGRGGAAGSGQRSGADQIGISIVNTLC